MHSLWGNFNTPYVSIPSEKRGLCKQKALALGNRLKSSPVSIPSEKRGLCKVRAVLEFTAWIFRFVSIPSEKRGLCKFNCAEEPVKINQIKSQSPLKNGVSARGTSTATRSKIPIHQSQSPLKNGVSASYILNLTPFWKTL